MGVERKYVCYRYKRNLNQKFCSKSSFPGVLADFTYRFIFIYLILHIENLNNAEILQLSVFIEINSEIKPCFQRHEHMNKNVPWVVIPTTAGFLVNFSDIRAPMCIAILSFFCKVVTSWLGYIVI